MSLRARVVVQRGAFALDIALDVADGEVVVLLGPNGSGKTTTLRALAGLLPLSNGRVELDGEVLDDVANRRRVAVERRAVGVVFQDYRLFPHMSAVDNVAYGLRRRGLGKATARARAVRLLERMGVAERARARPGALSGGQAQRVALARALAVKPRLLLLDEPMAALDAATRLDVRASLRGHLSDFRGATVLVTHDPLDAMVLGDRIVVLEAGAVAQEGSPADIARHPRTSYVARLVGLNLYRGNGSGGRVRLDGGGELTLADGVDGAAFVTVRPDAVALYRSRPDGSPRNVWQGVVRGVEMHGDHARVDVDGAPRILADVTPSAVADLGLTPGAAVWIGVKASETLGYSAALEDDSRSGSCS